ncbi:restriction endonuclease subunit S [Streptococcus sp. FT1-106]|uniref:restriction endonuclease subunit S n=1 Tax=Streptococcus sp. FT1-106 TaxID=3409994 RepID=UPI003BF4BD86
MGEVIDNLKGGVSITPNDYIENGYRTIPKGAVNDTGIADLSSCKNVSVDFFEKNYFSKTSTGELITSLRDLVPSAPNLGRIVRIVGQFEEFIMPQGVYSLKTSENLWEDFLIAYSNCYIYRNVIQSEKNGSTQVHIRNGEFLNIKIQLPSLPEQEAIGTFFSTLGQHITLHQRKLDMLKEQKKTYLKLLFPAKGQTKPALRFQGFEDDWEVKRISDIGDIVTGNTPSTSNEDYYSNEGMMWVTPTDIDGLIITDTNKKLSPEGEKVSRIVPANSILVTCIASIGKNTLLLEAGSFNQQINAVVPNQSLYHSYFLLTQSYFWSESMKRIAPAATMQIINKNEFSNITVPLPTLPEQKAIGTFFQTLDQEITQVEDKLASLKEMKKTLLRKLFVS